MGALLREPAQKLRAQDRLGGKYLLLKRIALGGMGQIWIARNEMTDAEVALKVLRGDIDKRIQVEPRFRHEARLGAMLAHRNIVRIFDLIEEPDGSLVLVMELLRGETLRRHLKNKGPLTAEEAIAIMLPVLSALEHAHEMGIVHRDIKPANIFLAVDPDGQITPKLLDFGIAKVPLGGGALTLDGRVLGTPRYMSPEQIRSEANIDGRSDIFSLGAVVVEMLTGQSPFIAETASASLASVLETLLDPDPRIDPRLWLVLQRALAKRPYERYASCAELTQALREAVGVSDHALHANLRRSKPPPRISATLSIARPDDAPPAPSSRDDDDVDDDSSDYAAGFTSAASESITGSRLSSVPGQRVRGRKHSGVRENDERDVRSQEPARRSRTRAIATGVGITGLLGLVFCGGLFFREAKERVTNVKPGAVPTASAAPPPASAAASVPEKNVSEGEVNRAEPAVPALADAPSASGPARRDPPPPASARPAVRPAQAPAIVKKKVATTPGF